LDLAHIDLAHPWAVRGGSCTLAMAPRMRDAILPCGLVLTLGTAPLFVPHLQQASVSSNRLPGGSPAPTRTWHQTQKPRTSSAGLVVSGFGAAALIGAAATATSQHTAPLKKISRKAASDAASSKAAKEDAKPTAGVPEAPKPKRQPFDPSLQLGALPPLGYFDPLGFSKVGDRQGFWEMRDREIHHGRVAMLALTGLIVQHFIHREAPEFQTAVKLAPTSLGAWTLFFGPGEFASFWLLFSTAAFIEVVWRPANQRKEAGNYGDPLGLNMYTPDMRSKEISNGRFAMICVMGVFGAELATGKDAVEQLGLGL